MGLFNFSHNNASWTQLRLMWRKPSIVFWGRLQGPTKVTPIVAARIDEEGGMVCVSVISTMSSVLSQYVDTFPQTPLWNPSEGQKRAPFFIGYNLTIYVAGKKRATRTCSGNVSTRRMSSTSPIHNPFARDSDGILPFRREPKQDKQMVTQLFPAVLVR